MTDRRPILVLGAWCLLAVASPGRAEPPPTADPKAKDAQTLAETIDRLVAARWQAEQVTPAPLSSDGEFLRRVYLDLVGRIPPIDVARDFLEDPAPDKRAQLVQRLLQSDAHTSHWTNVWRGWIIPPGTTVFRANPAFDSWLRQHLKARTGFDAMVRELVAGAAGQGTAGPQAFYQANEQKPENLAASTSRIFLGVKLECAQCHDHPFAPWKQKQFWELAAFFAGVPQPRVPGQAAAAPVDPNSREIAIPGTDQKAQARFLDGAEPQWEEGINPRGTLARWVAAPDNPYFARAAANRLWEYFLGTGLVDPVDEFSTENPPSHPELLDELGKQFAVRQFDLPFLVQAITLSQTYQRTSRHTHDTQGDPRLFARMTVRGLSPEQLFDSLAEAVGLEPGDDRGGRPAPGLAPARTEFLARFPPQEKRTEIQTSILQALYLMNGRFMSDATSVAGARNLGTILDAQNVPTARRLEELYLITLSRKPTADERTRLVEYVDQGGPTGNARKALTDVFWALLNSSEFFLNH